MDGQMARDGVYRALLVSPPFWLLYCGLCNVSAQLVIAGNFYKLKMFLVQGYKNESIELIVFENPKIDPWHKSIIIEKGWIV